MGAALHYRSVVPNISALDPLDRSLRVSWSDGVVSHYPWLWLRDHSHTSDTFDPGRGVRAMSIAAVPRALRGLSLDLVDDHVRITWDVLEPVSVLPVEFLHRFRLPRVARVDPESTPTIWNAQSLRLPAFELLPVGAVETVVAEVLAGLHQHGVCRVQGPPESSDATSRLLALLDPSATWQSVALTGPRTVHTSGLADDAAPGVVALACGAAGGAHGGDPDIVLVDGFTIARRLEADTPELFEVLCDVSVPGQRLEPGRHYSAARPVFRHDHTGRLIQVSADNRHRAPFLLDEGNMIEWYNAISAFEELAGDHSLQFHLRLLPGQILLIDNWRVLHGHGSVAGEWSMQWASLARDAVGAVRRSLR